MRATVYARVSRDRDGKSTSVDQQVSECRKYAATRGWDVERVLSDNDISAYTGRRRPAYEELLELLAAGSVEAVLVWEQSRLTRTPSELERYIELCEPRSVPTYSVTGGTLDLTTSQGRMTARIVGAVNRQEVDQLRQRVKRGLQGRAAAGKPIGGRRPLGFEEDRITHRKVEADAIKEACESLLQGDSLSGIARQWREAGITTTTGRKFTPQALRDVLLRARNAGWIEHKGDLLGRAEWKPIVSFDTWQSVRALLTDPSRRTTTGAQPRFLGSYLYLCGACGAVMRVGRGGGGKPRSYQCGGRIDTPKSSEKVRHPVIPQGPCDDFVSDYILRNLHYEGHFWAAPEETVTDSRDDRMTELEARRRTLVRNHVAGLIDDGDLEDALRIIAVQIAEVNVVPVQVSRTDASDLASKRSKWSEIPVERQRALLRDYAVVTILPATSTRQPVYYELEKGGELHSDRIHIKMRYPNDKSLQPHRTRQVWESENPRREDETMLEYMDRGPQ